MDFLSLDDYLFLGVNVGSANVLFDFILPLVREKLFWVPLYVFLLGIIAFNFSKGTLLKVLLCVVLTLLISDGLSSKVIKPSVGRLRPCHSLDLQDQMIKRVKCGSGKSFTSSHATNHFAIATFLFLFFQGWSKWRWLLIFWAGLISYAQVYVGVHYPFDVMAGAILGILVGGLIWSQIYARLP